MKLMDNLEMMAYLSTDGYKVHEDYMYKMVGAEITIYNYMTEEWQTVELNPNIMNEIKKMKGE